MCERERERERKREKRRRIYIYIYIYVCVCVRERERLRQRRNIERKKEEAYFLVSYNRVCMRFPYCSISLVLLWSQAPFAHAREGRREPERVCVGP